MHVPDWFVESLALSRAFKGAADVIGFIHQPRPSEDDPDRTRRGFRSCSYLLCVPSEVSSINPHSMQDNGEFSGERDSGPAAAFAAH